MAVSRVIGFGNTGNVGTGLNLGFGGFNLFKACCVGIDCAIGDVGDFVAAIRKPGIG